MLESGIDQAQGLRRMFAPGPARVIEVLGAQDGAGRTTVAVNLAVALARAGRQTLLLDAAAMPAAAQRSAGTGASKRQLPGFVVSPEGTPGPLRPLPQASPRARTGSFTAAQDLTMEADCIVVAACEPGAWCWPPQRATDALLVVSRLASSITAAYALIKRMGRQRVALPLQVLVNRVASEAEARQVYANLSDAARDYLGVRLQALGFVPADAALALAAAQGRSVLQTDPDAPASRAFRRLAERLLDAAPPAAQHPHACASPNRRAQASMSGAACHDIPL